jgi:SAM-dependent methyltransferase
MDRLVLDVTAGSRMMWFDKENPLALYTDIRELDDVLCDGRKLSIAPDQIADYRNLPFDDKQFKLVVFDPPHLVKLGEKSWMAKKYGVLSKDWRQDLRGGFEECWRVLDDNGVLIFKWNERDIKVKEVLQLFSVKPLFGHTTGRSGSTKWMTFIKANNGLEGVSHDPTITRT